MKTKTAQNKGRPVDLTHFEGRSQAKSCTHRSFFMKSTEQRGQRVEQGHGEAFPWAGVSGNQRMGSTHQGEFQNNCGLARLPISTSAWETLAVLQNVGCVAGS